MNGRLQNTLPAVDDPVDAEPRRLGLFLTLREAAAELCAEVSAAREWLVERGLLRHVAGQELVVPQELADAVVTANLAAGAVPRGGPITSWRRVASVLGVSDDTVGRRRKERRDVTPCHFADEREVREWWLALNAAVAPTGRAPRARSSRSEGGPLDVKALVNELKRR